MEPGWNRAEGSWKLAIPIEDGIENTGPSRSRNTIIAWRRRDGMAAPGDLRGRHVEQMRDVCVRGSSAVWWEDVRKEGRAMRCFARHGINAEPPFIS